MILKPQDLKRNEKKSEEIISEHRVALRNIRIAADGTNRNNVLQLQPIK